MKKQAKKPNPTPKLLSEIKKALRETKAIDPVALDLSPYRDHAYCDAVIVATGSSARHLGAMSDRIQADVKERLGRRPLGVEGERTGEWILIDYGDVIVHLFQQEIRYTYNIELLWSKAKKTAIRVARK